MPRKVTPFDNASLPRESGIYCITCTANGKIYIGSSVNIRKRWSRHLCSLEHHTHYNAHLQNAWDIYGRDSFSVSVLELCKQSELIKCEQRYLDILQPFRDRGFNIARNAELTSLGVPMAPKTRAKISAANKGRPKSAETRAKLSVSKRGQTMSPEARTKMSIARKGKPKSAQHRANISAANMGHGFSPETRAKMSAARKLRVTRPETRARLAAASSREFIVISPDGTRQFVINLAAYCREHNLIATTMVQVARGKRKHHKGWRCEYA